MAEKTRYSDAELEEFRAIILEKLEIAKRDYELLRSGVTNSDGNDVADTSPTFKVLEEGASTLSKEEAARAAVDAVRALSVRVGIPQHLSELGIKESDLDKLATAAIADVCTPGNPREVTKEIILDLYKKAL